MASFMFNTSSPFYKSSSSSRRSFVFFLTIALILLFLMSLLNLVQAAPQVKERKFYDLLGVKPGESDESILKKAYKRKALEYHPDKLKEGITKEEAQAKFVELTSAYQVLTDPQKKKIYDQHGEAGIKQMESGGGAGGAGNPFNQGFSGDFHDLWREMFRGFGGGGGHRGSPPPPSQGPSSRAELQIDLEDAFRGNNDYVISFQRRKVCVSCKGTGAKDPVKDIQNCPVCHGQGMQIIQQGFAIFQMPCSKCGGHGKTIKNTCPKCSGQKILNVKEDVHLKIPKGCPEGHRLVVPGMSDESPEYSKPGDLIITLTTRPHQMFTRKGDNLYHKAEPLVLRDALLGFNRSLRHLDGSKVSLKRTDVTQPNQEIIIPGEGMPCYHQPGKRGDLFVTLPVVLPPVLTPSQKKQFTEILTTEHDKVGENDKVTEHDEL